MRRSSLSQGTVLSLILSPVKSWFEFVTFPRSGSTGMVSDWGSADMSRVLER